MQIDVFTDATVMFTVYVKKIIAIGNVAHAVFAIKLALDLQRKYALNYQVIRMFVTVVQKNINAHLKSNFISLHQHIKNIEMN